MKIHILLLLIIVSGATAQIQEERQLPASDVKYKGDGDLIFLRDFGSDEVGYLAVPLEQPKCAVVVVHGWTGLSEGVRRDCDYLAERGYLALGIDLFNGTAPKNEEEAKALRGKLSQEIMVTAIQTAAAFFHGSPRFKMERVVVVAAEQSCLAALLAAQDSVKIMGVVLIEPEPVLKAAEFKRLQFPLKIIGDLDQGVESYLQMVDEPDLDLPQTHTPLIKMLNPVWINSWRNRRLIPELWPVISEFVGPLEVREEPMTKRLWNRVF